jgi:hypothetical protein
LQDGARFLASLVIRQLGKAHRHRAPAGERVE